MKTKLYCPNCELETEVVTSSQLEDVQVRESVIRVAVNSFQCMICGIEFADTETDPTEAAYREYRRRLNWTQPEVLSEFRKNIGLSQLEFAELLGWGVATVSRYENGALQSESHQQLLHLLLHDPLNLLTLLKAGKGNLNQEQRERLISKLTPGKGEFITTHFTNVFSKDAKDEFSGNQRFSLSKLIEIILFFCKSGCHKTSLNKLLFYSDFKAFKELNSSITGARYVKLPYGPVINDFNYYFAALVEGDLLEIDEIHYQNGWSGEKYASRRAADLSSFEESEREILEFVKKELGELTAREISDRSHMEYAYKLTNDKEPISYNHAARLSI